MRLDKLTREEREARADQLVREQLERQGIVPGNASPALLARTVRLLSGVPVPTDKERTA